MDNTMLSSAATVMQSGASLFETTASAVEDYERLYGRRAREQANANYRAQLSKNDAVMARYEAQHARAMSAIEARKLSEAFIRERSAVRVRSLASGAVMEAGASVADVLADHKSEQVLKVLEILHEGAMTGWRFENNARMADARREMSLMQARAAEPQGFKRALLGYETAGRAWGYAGALRNGLGGVFRGMQGLLA